METVTLKPGGSHIVVLDGLGSAGYQWVVDAVDPQIATVEEVLHLREELGAPIQGSLDQRFKISAIAPGQMLVRFIQKRRFGPVAEPLSTHEINLVVTNDE